MLHITCIESSDPCSNYTRFLCSSPYIPTCHAWRLGHVAQTTRRFCGLPTSKHTVQLDTIVHGSTHVLTKLPRAPHMLGLWYGAAQGQPGAACHPRDTQIKNASDPLRTGTRSLGCFLYTCPQGSAPLTARCAQPSTGVGHAGRRPAATLSLPRAAGWAAVPAPLRLTAHRHCSGGPAPPGC